MAKDETDKEKEMLALMHERYEACKQRYQTDYEKGETDLEMLAGKNHWNPDLKALRQNAGQVCLTLNHLPQFVHRVANDVRQASPAIKVLADDDDATQETANFFRGKIRKIEQRSQADIAYDTACMGAISCGYGYFRILSEYKNPMSFDQELKIQAIPNPFSVYLDANHKEPDGSDSKYGFIREEISRKQFEADYPDASIQSFDNEKVSGWVTETTVQIAEYIYIEEKEEDIALLNTGDVLRVKEAKKLVEANPDMFQIVQERTTKIPVVHWCKTNGYEILEKTDWPGRFIPIVKVIGWELYLDGKPHVFSMVRHAIDGQKMYNYWKSAHTEIIALQPKASFIATAKQIKGYENIYKQANKRNFPVLLYNQDVDAKTGAVAPPPQRQAPPQASSAMVLEAQGAIQDIKGAMGIYDENMGMESNAIAGVAIRQRQIQGDNATFHFIDNLSRSIRHAGNILVDLIPAIYPGEREETILKDDGEEERVAINQPFDRDNEETGETEQVLIEPAKGQYDVVVDVGPSYATKRQQALESLLDLSTKVPEIMTVAGDLIAKNMDWEGAEEISKRLKHLLPPELKGEDKAAMIQQQADQMIEALQGRIGQLESALMDKTMREDRKHELEVAKLELEYKKASIEEMASQAEAVKDLSEALEGKQFELEDALTAIDMLIQHNEQAQTGPEQSPVDNLN